MIAAALTVIVGTGMAAGPAVASQVHTWWDGEVLVINTDALQVQYLGELYSWEQIGKLQEQGLAQVTVMDPSSSIEGFAHAFDTQQQADTWVCTNLPDIAASGHCPPAG